jgi:hypothetical protein
MHTGVTEKTDKRQILQRAAEDRRGSTEILLYGSDDPGFGLRQEP